RTLVPGIHRLRAKHDVSPGRASAKPRYSARNLVDWCRCADVRGDHTDHAEKMLIAGLIAVSMNPISMLVLGMRHGWEFGSRWLALVMHQPDYLLVGAAVVISHVVTKLGQQVTKARELGSYQLGELLGRGGMGEVDKATHRMLARPAAIKLIRPEMLGAVDKEAAKLAVTRFRREAEA